LCGLVGVFGHIDDQVKAVFRWMLYLDVFRGPHSTGIHVVDGDYNGTTYKELGLPHNVWTANPDVFTNDGIAKGEPVLLMGHNRWATKGEINKDNAHPFTFGPITGCHNGTLQDYDLKLLKESEKYDVDSKVLYRNIELDGIEDIWKKVYGAMALTWWNDDEGALYIIRNAQRPLNYWFYMNTLFWASEKWIIDDARRAAGIQNRGEIREVPINKLHKFSVDKHGVVKEEVTSINPFVLKPAASSNVVNIGANTKTDNFTTVKIKEWIEVNGNNPARIGYFVAEDTKIPNKEYIIEMYAATNAESIARKEEILENSKEGFNTYTLNLTNKWVDNGYEHINVRNLSLWKGWVEPKLTDSKKDKIGTEVYYQDFRHFMCEDGCVSCYSPVVPRDWDRLEEFVCLPDEGAILCPNCTDPELVEQVQEFMKTKRFDFMRNWS
jgi:hypothetical protein